MSLKSEILVFWLMKWVQFKPIIQKQMDVSYLNKKFVEQFILADGRGRQCEDNGQRRERRALGWNKSNMKK